MRRPRQPKNRPHTAPTQRSNAPGGHIPRSVYCTQQCCCRVWGQTWPRTFHSPQCAITGRGAGDFLPEALEEQQETVFDAAADLLSIDMDLIFFTTSTCLETPFEDGEPADGTRTDADIDARGCVRAAVAGQFEGLETGSSPDCHRDAVIRCGCWCIRSQSCLRVAVIVELAGHDRAGDP
jgi:hypothetical protein